ncbi:DUF4047 domain-containing protein [Bacillus cytotoxicus]|uniref:DUF4047 domain-containing protein n=1 Tax=Bacillus cytotoxicus (strain DSM 22905 / CIP 110041 / 391-98 / NVH 391-98) TaxID=315749 RepID=A7GMG9_BACCN|nr:MULTISPECIES: DUF4047 domain-containing protein [Bacillus cereus group]ABS21327.1 conserved hypothetical protein [Bacillus cytotoxicus NVH 391-98]AWC27976.1 DUF4047 domain-containing protein [Bacillus cytotoxicus]AWC32016.1 DUF4047 domain-containing protein [Bacillus cytotoxicus]AWC36048.1 DUF4047 domain-containing protein [Bacillus cytotoxicus]AWC40642.1 DUF4047 domain-containing protein [Bacillus cytotoxicus]
MPKALKRIKMMLVFPCMCSVAFYMGAQIVTHTEAAFVTEQKVQGSIAAAPVFPKTIYTLKQTAKQHEKVILQVYENMKKEVEEEASIEVLENRLVSWKEQREKVAFERELLQKIYIEMEGYYHQLQESHSQEQLQSVKENLNVINMICKNVDKAAGIQKIDEEIRTLQKQVDAEKGKKLHEQANVLEKQEAEHVTATESTATEQPSHHKEEQPSEQDVDSHLKEATSK